MGRRGAILLKYRSPAENEFTWEAIGIKRIRSPLRLQRHKARNSAFKKLSLSYNERFFFKPVVFSTQTNVSCTTSLKAIQHASSAHFNKREKKLTRPLYFLTRLQKRYRSEVNWLSWINKFSWRYLFRYSYILFQQPVIYITLVYRGERKEVSSPNYHRLRGGRGVGQSHHWLLTCHSMCVIAGRTEVLFEAPKQCMKVNPL